MKIHYLQHVPFEGIGYIQQWADDNKHSVSKTELFNNQAPPSTDDYDLLIVMGGPMGIYDYEEYPWLKDEKEYIKNAIDVKKTILGICLGAQIIADVLGGEVTHGKNKEIGWFPIVKTSDANNTKLGSLLPNEMMAYHWHGDTFSVPEGATRLYTSEACSNQAFIYNDNIVALQFHLETTEKSMGDLISNCEHELVDAPYIQTRTEMTNGMKNIRDINCVMNKIMEYLISR